MMAAEKTAVVAVAGQVVLVLLKFLGGSPVIAPRGTELLPEVK